MKLSLRTRLLGSHIIVIVICAAAYTLAGFSSMKENLLPVFIGITIGGIGLSFVICHLLFRSLEERDDRLRRQAQNEIMESSRLAMMGRMATGVAHEINNPLGAILLFSQLLLRSAPEKGVERENLERISREAGRCRKIVRGILEFAGRREKEIRQLDMNDVVEKSVSLVENLAALHNVAVIRQYRQDLPAAEVDESQMEQVFVNIVMNAAEAMEGRGALTISTTLSASGDRIETSFADTGRGISGEDLPRLFEPFYTTKETGQGTGLGLSISREIVESHGGTIRVISTPGEGSNFIVSLPVSKDAALRQAEETD